MRACIKRSSLLLLLAFLLNPPIALEGQTGTAEVNGVTLPYEITGSGKPLVLIHGWAVHRGFWDTDVEHLGHQYAVIRYDRRGFGGATGKPDITADAADLKALLEALDVPRAHIMGHSQGAAVALTFALRHPEMVDGLVLFGSPPPDGFGLPPGADGPPIGDWAVIGKTHGVDSLKAAIGMWAAQQFGGNPESMAARAGPLMGPYTGLDLIDPDPPLNLAAPARIDELGMVRAPTLVIHGQHEMPYFRVVAGMLTYGIPDARRAVLRGGGHVVNWAEPERFAAEVLRFLREVDEGS
jgi:pimeloyl-ACP methyl ester carboxylesterase